MISSNFQSDIVQFRLEKQNRARQLLEQSAKHSSPQNSVNSVTESEQQGQKPKRRKQKPRKCQEKMKDLVEVSNSVGTDNFSSEDDISLDKLALNLKKRKLTETIKDEKVTKRSRGNSGSMESSQIQEVMKSYQDPITCRHCLKTVANLETLAEHQSDHLKVRLWNLCNNPILPEIQRKTRQANSESIECMNCLSGRKLPQKYPKFIKSHWESGICEYFCKICGQKFHQDPKLLESHYRRSHGLSMKTFDFSELLEDFERTYETLEVGAASENDEATPDLQNSGSIVQENDPQSHEDFQFSDGSNSPCFGPIEELVPEQFKEIINHTIPADPVEQKNPVTFDPTPIIEEHIPALQNTTMDPGTETKALQKGCSDSEKALTSPITDQDWVISAIQKQRVPENFQDCHDFQDTLNDQFEISRIAQQKLSQSDCVLISKDSLHDQQTPNHPNQQIDHLSQQQQQKLVQESASNKPTEYVTIGGYSCAECPRYFETKRSFYDHYRSEHEKRP
jgi:hypothetical protein